MLDQISPPGLPQHLPRAPGLPARRVIAIFPLQMGNPRQKLGDPHPPAPASPYEVKEENARLLQASLLRTPVLPRALDWGSRDGKFLEHGNTDVPHDPEMPLLGTRPQELNAGTHTDMCTSHQLKLVTEAQR